MSEAGAWGIEGSSEVHPKAGLDCLPRLSLRSLDLQRLLETGELQAELLLR